MEPCRIGMADCSRPHHIGRQLLAWGHAVKLMPPKNDKPSANLPWCVPTNAWPD